jgi:hypothetical protein
VIASSSTCAKAQASNCCKGMCLRVFAVGKTCKQQTTALACDWRMFAWWFEHALTSTGAGGEPTLAVTWPESPNMKQDGCHLVPVAPDEASDGL